MQSKSSVTRYFFTLSVMGRHQELLLRHKNLLSMSFSTVAQEYPFKIIAMVILPEHLHCVLEFPSDDSDYARCWTLIQAQFAKHLSQREFLSRSRLHRRARGVWQRQYKEYQIHNESDLRVCIDYIRQNPVKHGYVKREQDWPHSLFQ